MKLKSAIILSVSLFWSGCGSDLSPNANRRSNAANNAVNENVAAANSQNQNDSSGGKLILSGISKTETYPCNGREVEIEEPTTTSKYTLTGECSKLTVDGVSNQIKIDKVGEIVVAGVSNRIVYGEGIGGKKPKITKGGTSTSVESLKERQEKEKAESK